MAEPMSPAAEQCPCRQSPHIPLPPDAPCLRYRLQAVSLYVPGEVLRQRLVSTSPIVLYVSRVHNSGVDAFLTELQAAYPSITVTDDPQSLHADEGFATHFLLYLNRGAFVGESGDRLAQEVRCRVRKLARIGNAR